MAPEVYLGRELRDGRVEPDRRRSAGLQEDFEDPFQDDLRIPGRLRSQDGGKWDKVWVRCLY